MALNNSYILGLKTNLFFILSCLKDPDFIAGEITTSFLKKITLELEQEVKSDSIIWFIAAWFYTNVVRHQLSRNMNLNPWYNNKSSQKIKLWLLDANQQIVQENTVDITANIDVSNAKILYLERYKILYIRYDNKEYLFSNQGYNIAQYGKKDSNALTAPMPGMVVSINVNNGDQVKFGDILLILEAMKMEHTIVAPKAGVIKNIFYKKGEQVPLGAELLVVE
jgi:3-methylcrotonyl-CoA carboxylase alpha subunit